MLLHTRSVVLFQTAHSFQLSAFLSLPQPATYLIITMCNKTMPFPNQTVSAPFRSMKSKQFLKDDPDISVQPMSVPSTTAVSDEIPKKPMRPLTAYHIYFQIEREFIIQSLPGTDADKSIHDGKKCLEDVPDRYRSTKLSPDWYFGPGKRAKRKHRKQHGKIGFLELSRVISTRWAKLEETDPDIKDFVSKLAKQELEVYQREVEEYKKLTKDMNQDEAPAPKPAAAKKSKKRKQSEQSRPQKVIHPITSVVMSSPTHQMITPEMIASYQRTFHGATHPIGYSFMNNSVQLRREIDQLKNEIHYVNSCIDKYSKLNSKPTPTFTIKTTSSAPPKKQFFRRRSSDISLSFLDSIMSDVGKSDPSEKKMKKTFYRRQSSNVSLSFLDSLIDDTGKNNTMSKSSSVPKNTIYRRQSSTLSLSFLDPIVDNMTKDEASTAIAAGKRQQKFKSFPVNVADVNDDDIMSLWVAQNSTV